MGLAWIICFLVATEGAKALLVVPADALTAIGGQAAQALAAAAWRVKEIGKLSVPAGIASGLIAGGLYNRYATIALPSYLGFFGGRRFVPIAAGVVGLGLALAFGGGFPLFEAGVDGLSRWVVASGPLGLFVYGLLNRLLLVTGLHHILNNIAWLLLAEYGGATGDLKRFFAEGPSAGVFVSGFFPVMMFGLPAACLAMYRASLSERRKEVAGLYLSLALTAFLTGVTEPIEFTFLFLAPALFAIHAVLTGLAMVVKNLLDVKLGFGFSAGLLDYPLNVGLATRPLLLVPVGLAYAGVYDLAFGWTIRRFDLKTPGRETEAAAAAISGAGPAGDSDRPRGFVDALGAANIVEIDACTTRLRLVLNDAGAMDAAALAALGARGTFDLGRGRVQVVVGSEVDQLASAMRSAAGAAAPGGATPAPIRPALPLSEEATPQDRFGPFTDMLRGCRYASVQARRHRLILAPPAQPLTSGLSSMPFVRAVVQAGNAVHILLDGPAAGVARALIPAAPPGRDETA